ncbi:MAG: AMP-binding protein, partial [Ilumatobacteraceae bacterium]
MSIISALDAHSAQSKAARGLMNRRLQIGDRVGFCLGSSPNLLFAIAGALRIGVIPVVINPQLLDAERKLIVDDSDIAMLISTETELAALFECGKAELAQYPL